MGFERLGATAEFGSLLIRLAGLRGWTLARMPLFAGSGHLYTLVRDSDTIGPVRGRCLADVATELFLEAMARDDSPNTRRTTDSVNSPDPGRR